MFGLLLNRIEPLWELLLRPAVRKDLKFTRAQDVAVMKIWSDAEERLEQVNRGRIDPRAISHQGMVMEIALPAFRRFGSGLTDAQTDRMVELTLQSFGPNVLAYPGVADYLHVTPSQLQKIGSDQLSIRKTWDARIMAFAKRRHVKMVGLKGGGHRPIETPEIAQMQRQENAELERVIRFTFSPKQNLLYLRLSGRAGKPN